jgi:Flp pilus assembly protein TadG
MRLHRHDRQVPRARARRARTGGGQALVETAIVVVMLTFLILGIMELGWAFLRTNMIVHAARDGGRYAATLDVAYRDPTTKYFTGAGITKIQTHVNALLSTVGYTAPPAVVTVDQACDGAGATAVPTVQVTITGPFPLLFNLIPGSFSVSRSVVFQDEKRKCT